MHDALTTFGMILLTVVALLGAVLALLRLRIRGAAPHTDGAIRHLLLALAVGSLLLFAYRETVVHRSWAPLATNADGILLIATLLAMTLLYLETPQRFPGVCAFGLPLLWVLLAWGICASYWTLHNFNVSSVWSSAHLLLVYVGVVFFALAAASGVMYLYGERSLRRKRAEDLTRPWVSLEKLERLLLRTSSLGFALLTLGMVMGLVLISLRQGAQHAGWWHSPKVVLAVTTWGVYALLVNARGSASFRGSRAAYLSILGLVLLVLVFGIATRGGGRGAFGSAPLEVRTS